MNTQALWPQMISALAAIDDELGLPQDGCNSTAQTLAAIRAMKQQRKTLLAALVGLHDVCALVLAGKKGERHEYFASRAGHFVHAGVAMRAAEEAIARIEGREVTK